jgi:hypothetical protein
MRCVGKSVVILGRLNKSCTGNKLKYFYFARKATRPTLHLPNSQPASQIIFPSSPFLLISTLIRHVRFPSSFSFSLLHFSFFTHGLSTFSFSFLSHFLLLLIMQRCHSQSFCELPSLALRCFGTGAFQSFQLT